MALTCTYLVSRQLSTFTRLGTLQNVKQLWLTASNKDMDTNEGTMAQQATIVVRGKWNPYLNE